MKFSFSTSSGLNKESKASIEYSCSSSISLFKILDASCFIELNIRLHCKCKLQVCACTIESVLYLSQSSTADLVRGHARCSARNLVLEKLDLFT